MIQPSLASWPPPSLGANLCTTTCDADGLRQNLGFLPYGVDHVGRLRLGFQQEEKEAGGRSGEGQGGKLGNTPFFSFGLVFFSLSFDRETVVAAENRAHSFRRVCGGRP